jgi:hypothetical protein
LLLGVGWSLVLGPVRPMSVVVILVCGEDMSGVGVVHDQNVV